ncbi:unnamed protein product [Darwinula stevensoni]|uniref:Uncharacterized protein n=1 Tax=Darwinula stevensoni TaxID=69355 RepID=A0A7R8XCW1_9CRUS|nr:unnamed protein product [Darwinula stevensoni]CAG0892939.1 unnamed protein product [Darwinula stevensoni]
MKALKNIRKAFKYQRIPTFQHGTLSAQDRFTGEESDPIDSEEEDGGEKSLSLSDRTYSATEEMPDNYGLANDSRSACNTSASSLIQSSLHQTVVQEKGILQDLSENMHEEVYDLKGKLSSIEEEKSRLMSSLERQNEIIRRLQEELESYRSGFADCGKTSEVGLQVDSAVLEPGYSSELELEISKLIAGTMERTYEVRPQAKPHRLLMGDGHHGKSLRLTGGVDRSQILSSPQGDDRGQGLDSSRKMKGRFSSSHRRHHERLDLHSDGDRRQRRHQRRRSPRNPRLKRSNEEESRDEASRDEEEEDERESGKEQRCRDERGDEERSLETEEEKRITTTTTSRLPAYIHDRRTPCPTPLRADHRQPVWFMGKIKALIGDKKRKWDAYKRTGDSTDYEEYKRITRKLKREIRSARREVEERLASDAKKNPRAFYRKEIPKENGEGKEMKVKKGRKEERKDEDDTLEGWRESELMGFRVPTFVEGRQKRDKGRSSQTSGSRGSMSRLQGILGSVTSASTSSHPRSKFHPFPQKGPREGKKGGKTRKGKRRNRQEENETLFYPLCPGHIFADF